MALIFFPGFMNGELDTDALHAGMPAVDVKWVSQVWLRQSFREDGQPSQPVPRIEPATAPLRLCVWQLAALSPACSTFLICVAPS